MVYSIWGYEDCQWSALDSIGQSGGILTIWRKEVFCPVFTFRGQGFLGINVL